LLKFGKWCKFSSNIKAKSHKQKVWKMRPTCIVIQNKAYQDASIKQNLRTDGGSDTMHQWYSFAHNLLALQHFWNWFHIWFVCSLAVCVWYFIYC
jgi:hypothetical protein